MEERMDQSSDLVVNDQTSLSLAITESPSAEDAPKAWSSSTVFELALILTNRPQVNQEPPNINVQQLQERLQEPQDNNDPRPQEHQEQPELNDQLPEDHQFHVRIFPSPSKFDLHPCSSVFAQWDKCITNGSSGVKNMF